MNQTLISLLNQYNSIACCYWILTLFALGGYGADAICEVRCCVSLYGLCWRDVDVECEGARPAGHPNAGYEVAARTRGDHAGRCQKKLVRLHWPRREQKICWERVGPTVGARQSEMGFRLRQWATTGYFSEIRVATRSRVHCPCGSKKVADYDHDS